MNDLIAESVIIRQRITERIWLRSSLRYAQMPSALRKHADRYVQSALEYKNI